MLTQQEITYSQQQKREYIWIQCEVEFEMFHSRLCRSCDDNDQDWIYNKYEELCKKSNITIY